MAVLEELNKGASDRAVGIIAASLVEIHLTKLLQHGCIQEAGTKDTVLKNMFRSSGPMGPFGNKTRMAYLLGMISEECFKNLETMRDIRNRFAHHTEIGSFEHEEVSSRCFNFTLVDKYVSDENAGRHGDPSALFLYEKPGSEQLLKNPKSRYVLSAHIFSMGIQSATVNPKPYKPAF